MYEENHCRIVRGGGGRAGAPARPDVDVTYVSGEQIAEGALDHVDVLLIPGGRRDKMWKAARPLVEKFVADGHRVAHAVSEL